MQKIKLMMLQKPCLKIMFWNRKKISSDTEHTSAKTDNQKASGKTVPLSFLKRLIPIGHLSDTELQQLKITITHHKPGKILFSLGEPSTSLPYLIKGECFVETSKGYGNKIEASTLKAFYPLSNASQHQCTAIAKSDVSIIHFAHNVLQHCHTDPRNALLNSSDVPAKLRDNLFFKRFCKYYKKGELVIPSLPDVAVKLRTAIQKDLGIHEIVKIINLDPVIASKLIQVVNSPIYRTVNEISTCQGAVTRLGLITTRNLVTSISMRNIFKSKNKDLNYRIRKIWKQSIQVSSISHTLAQFTKRIDPDEALLAGLVHNIGAIPIILFANSINSEDYTSEDINLCLTELQGLLGNIVLEKWGFPESIRQTPRQIENWYHSSSDRLDISDIVLLAKFHSYIGSKQMQNLPPIHTLPAFQKLGDNALTPDMSLQTLHNAKKQISEAMSLFNP